MPLSEAIAFGRHLEALTTCSSRSWPTWSAEPPAGPAVQEPQGEAASRADRATWSTTSRPGRNMSSTSAHSGGRASTSLGFYIPPKRGQGRPGARLLFPRPGGRVDATATLYHEVSHQLLFESAPGRNVLRKNVGNYWVFEGLGTYFETLVASPTARCWSAASSGRGSSEAKTSGRKDELRPDRELRPCSAKGSTATRPSTCTTPSDGPDGLPDAGEQAGLPRRVPRLRQGRLSGPAQGRDVGRRSTTASACPTRARRPASWR